LQILESTYTAELIGTSRLGLLAFGLNFFEFRKFTACLALPLLVLLVLLFFLLGWLLLFFRLFFLISFLGSLVFGNCDIASFSIFFFYANLVAVEKTLLLEFSNNLSHGVLVFTGLGATGKELESFFDLTLKALSKFVSRSLTEAINAGSDSALVCKVSGDFTFVLKSSAANKSTVEDETILGGFTLGFQSAEESLLSAEDLDGAGWILRKIGQATGMSD